MRKCATIWHVDIVQECVHLMLCGNGPSALRCVFVTWRERRKIGTMMHSFESWINGHCVLKYLFWVSNSCWVTKLAKTLILKEVCYLIVCMWHVSGYLSCMEDGIYSCVLSGCLTEMNVINKHFASLSLMCIGCEARGLPAHSSCC
jgi:hypothetical protein